MNQTILLRQRGLGLIEVLVAVLILGVGLLGLASLQVVSTKMNGGAQQRSQGVLLAYDMLDRIRANMNNAASYATLIDNAGVNCDTTFQPAASSSVAVKDLAEWTNSLACLLPDATARIQITAANQVTLNLDWARQDPNGLPINLLVQL